MKRDSSIVSKPTTQSHPPGIFPRKSFSIDLKALKKKDPNEVVNTLNQRMPGLKFCL